MEYIIDAIRLGMSGYDVGHLFRHIFVCFVLFHLTPCFVVADFISGTCTAKKLKEPLRSHRFRKSIEKQCWYWLAQILVFIFGLIGTLFDFYYWPYLSIVVTAAICVIEVKSMLEHAKRRRCHTAKIPEAIQEIANLVGGVENLKDILQAIKIINPKS